MTFSAAVLEVVSALEQETGKPFSSKALMMVESAYQLSLVMLNLGQRHKQEGYNPLLQKEIESIVQVKYASLQEAICEMMHDAYMEGYNNA